MLQIAGCGEHHSVRAIMVTKVGNDCFPAELPDDLRPPEYRSSHCLVGIGAFLEMIKDDVVGGIVGLTDLLQDYCALAIQFLRVESRMLQNVSKDIESERYILLEDFRVVGRALARGVGVDMAADCFDLLGDRASAPTLGALEGHMLKEVCDAIDLRRFVPRADIDPDTKRDRFDRFDLV